MTGLGLSLGLGFGARFGDRIRVGVGDRIQVYVW